MILFNDSLSSHAMGVAQTHGPLLLLYLHLPRFGATPEMCLFDLLTWC